MAYQNSNPTGRRRRRHIRWDRVILVFGPIILLIIFLCVKCGKNENDPAGSSSLPESSIVIPTADSQPAPESAPDSAPETSEAVPSVLPVEHEYTIVIDPGHGGNDGGATNAEGTRFEKDDNLRLSLAVRDRLLQYPHVRVIMTRETDVFVELSERCKIANASGADFFVSIHRNSAKDGNGVEIWVNNNATDNSMDKLLAGYILELLDKEGISSNRGVQLGYRGSTRETVGNNYYVNRNTDMPSCLVEMGFMSSTIDNNNFDSKLDNYADAIATAIIELGTDKQIYNASAQ